MNGDATLKDFLLESIRKMRDADTNVIHLTIKVADVVVEFDLVMKSMRQETIQ